MIVFESEVARPAGMFRCLGQVTPCQGVASSMQRHGTLERAEFVFIHDDHAGHVGGMSLTELQPPLGVPQAGIDAVDLTAREEHSRIGVAEHRPAAEHLVGQRGEPTTEHALLSTIAQRWPGELDELGRAREITGSEGVVDGVRTLTVLLIPVARPSVQLLYVVGRLLRQTRAKHVRKEVVVAIPLTAVVQRDDEQVPSFERLQLGLAIVEPGDGITHRTAQALQYRGSQQETSDLLGLAL
jgi:hypothetical protein